MTFTARGAFKKQNGHPGDFDRNQKTAFYRIAIVTAKTDFKELIIPTPGAETCPVFWLALDLAPRESAAYGCSLGFKIEKK